MITTLIGAAVLAVAYGAADRFAGGGWPELDDKLPGRSVFWAALVCAGLGWLVLGLAGALGAFGWFLYRTPGWRVFGGSATPVSSREIAGTFARHALIVPLVALAAYFSERGLKAPVFWMLAYAVGATLLAFQYGRENQAATEAGKPIDPSINAKLEKARGALFGLALAFAF